MKRRTLLRSLMSAMMAPLWPTLGSGAAVTAPLHAGLKARVRPGQPGWPSAKQWHRLSTSLNGKLQPLGVAKYGCASAATNVQCAPVEAWRNPFAVGDDPEMIQNVGWYGAWTFAPSQYTVIASNANDVARAVTFASKHHLRLVVKGGGHSYQGTSNSADSLLIFTRQLNSVTMHDAFVAKGCEADPGRPAVSAGSGTVWMQLYKKVCVDAGRYVQGGGCTTVGVAGHVQSGGYGSFSRGFGTSSANLIEAEIVTADGQIRIANRNTNPDLFWAIKGGGGGTFGVVTRLTLATHPLPERIGLVSIKIEASRDAAYKRLIERTMGFYRDSLMNPHWGEQIVLHSNRTMEVKMVFQGIDKASAQDIWADYINFIKSDPELSMKSPPFFIDVPGRAFWNADILQKFPNTIVRDDRTDAAPGSFVWAGDAHQCGQILYAYKSVWLPDALLSSSSLTTLSDALFNAARTWGLELHFNKGLAGGSVDNSNTAAHPASSTAFALAILGANSGGGKPGALADSETASDAKESLDGVSKATAFLTALVPSHATYLAESDYFADDWQSAYWGSNYQRLLEIKRNVDPEGLFFVHHGVGSELWSADGFTPV